MAFIAGAYTFTWNSLSLGQLFEGLTLNHVTFKEIIRGDNFAQAAQDAVFQGIDITSDCILNEWNAAAAATLFWPYGTPWLTAGVVGRLDVQQTLAKSLIGTAVTGPPAQSLAAPATITLPRSILHENFPVQHIFRPAHRKVPIRMRHYPASDGVYGTLT